MEHGESSVSKPYKEITDVGISEARLFFKEKQHFDVMILVGSCQLHYHCTSSKFICAHFQLTF